MSLSDKVSVNALRSILGLGALLGPSTNVQLGKKLGSLVSYFTPRELGAVEAQLQFASRTAPELKSYSPQQLLSDIYSHIGESVSGVG